MREGRLQPVMASKTHSGVAQHGGREGEVWSWVVLLLLLLHMHSCQAPRAPLGWWFVLGCADVRTQSEVHIVVPYIVGGHMRAAVPYRTIK